MYRISTLDYADGSQGHFAIVRTATNAPNNIQYYVSPDVWTPVCRHVFLDRSEAEGVVTSLLRAFPDEYKLEFPTRSPVASDTEGNRVTVRLLERHFFVRVPGRASIPIAAASEEHALSLVEQLLARNGGEIPLKFSADDVNVDNATFCAADGDKDPWECVSSNCVVTSELLVNEKALSEHLSVLLTEILSMEPTDSRSAQEKFEIALDLCRDFIGQLKAGSVAVKQK